MHLCNAKFLINTMVLMLIENEGEIHFLDAASFTNPKNHCKQ